MVNTVPRNLKEIHNYPAEGKVTNTERNHGLSGRFPDTVNVNIGPVITASLLKVSALCDIYILKHFYESLTW